MSGPIAVALAPILQGVQIWSKWVNVNGGVGGHQVLISAADDGGDPARHRALIQDLVENGHVLAFLVNAAPLTGNAAIPYLEAKRIPLVGMTTGESWAYESPMQFPHASSGPALIESTYGSWAQQGLARGKSKFGLLTCSEVQICHDFASVAADQSKRRGVQLVYKGQISLAQPDFTAECLSAKSAGVEVLIFIADSNSLGRMAASCARQQYQPIFATGAQVTVDSLKSNPLLNNHFLVNSPVFPYFQTGSAATEEYQAAFQRFHGSVDPAGGVATGWAGGKLFEAAAGHMPEPPTTQAILDGLWGLRNVDFGGLTPPLTFLREQKPSPVVCWWNVALTNGAWVSSDNFARHCD